MILIKKFFTSLSIIILAQCMVNYSYAVEPNEILKNENQELRARNISKNIRCLICQNQSIDDSNASLARDLRILIRNQIKEGKNEKEIYKFLSDRYGDFILLKPPLNLTTYFLWIFPFFILLIGMFFIFWQNINSKKNIK